MDTKAIRARCEAATEGEWRSYTEVAPGGIDNFVGIGVFDCWTPSKADADFISHAKSDIPALLDEVERLTRVSDEYDRCKADCGSLENIELHKRIAELEDAVRGIIAGLNSQRGYYPKTVALLEKAIKGNAIKENKK